MPEKNKKRKQTEERNLTQKAIHEGLKYLTSQPGLRNYAVLMSNNLDNEKIYSFIEGAEKELKEKNIPDEQHDKLIYNSLASYVASGNALKDTVRRTILEESREGKLSQNVLEKIVEFFKPHKFEGEKYFEKARNAYGDMYDILSQDEIAQKEIPELTKAAKAMRMYGFLDVALKNFKAHGMMDDKMSKMLSQELYKNTAIKSQKGMKGLENYILAKEIKEEENKVPQKVAASIIALFGITLIAFNSRITGAVIGNSEASLSGFIGILMIILSLGLFLKFIKKKL